MEITSQLESWQEHSQKKLQASFDSQPASQLAVV
jgi:hypothetical protein